MNISFCRTKQLVPKVQRTKQWEEDVRIECVYKFDEMGDTVRMDRSFYNLKLKRKTSWSI